jgi:alpha-mannosidase
LATESLPNGTVLCQIEMPAVGVGAWKLARRTAEAPGIITLPEIIETKFYAARIDRGTGALVSLRFKKSGRELLGGPANVIVAERPAKQEAAPADFMAARPDRMRLASSSDHPSTVQLSRGPVAFTIRAKGTFYGGGSIQRVIRFYHESPRIDFETELNDIPSYTVVVSEFPLASDILEVRRGIPFGFSHGAWAVPNPSLQGWTRGIVPAVRWIDYSLAGGGGVALFDRGLTGRELNGRTPIIYLLNAENEYHGFPNPWLTGKGRHVMPYSLVPHEEAWTEARVPQMAWEYNRMPVVIPGRVPRSANSYVATSDNVIVEALRREGDHIEIRLVECFGLPGVATVNVSLPHQSAMLTDLIGRKQSDLPHSSAYRIPVRPQQIVTLHLQTTTALTSAEPTTAWDPFVPEKKLAALHRYEPEVKGHPPFGDGIDF